jgi:Family of unknown function (DUF6502)
VLQPLVAPRGELASVSGLGSLPQRFAMQSQFRAALVHLCNRVLYPLVRILVRFGVSAGELKSIVDSVYAHAGSDYLTRQGERVTYSRLAVITGINRSVLPAIMAAPREGDFQPRSSTQLHRAARVLSGWYDDREFQNRAGEPAVLPLRGGRRSFQQLARRYSGGVYYWTILSELERLGAVARVASGGVRAMRRSLSAGGANAESIYSAGEYAGDLMATLEHNLAARTHEQLPVRTLVLPVAARSLPLFRAQVGRRADAVLEQIESFLQSHRPRHGREPQAAASSRTLELGATVFAICRGDDGPERHEPSVAERAIGASRRRKM